MYGVLTSFGHSIRLLMLAVYWVNIGRVDLDGFEAYFILFITAALTRLKLLLIKRSVSGMDVITSCEMLAIQWLGAVMVRDLISVTVQKWSLYMCYDSAIVCLTGSTGI